MKDKIYFSEVVLLTKTYSLQDFEDWLFWHVNVVNFDHVMVFDNESTEDIKSVCEKYGSKVTYKLIKGWPNQYELYNKYVNEESRAWWVLTIDDDEFFYVSERFNHNVNDVLMYLYEEHPDWTKLCVGWRNLFPKKFTEQRLDKHLIVNATGWSDEASEIWQAGNKPVKTFVKTTRNYQWCRKNGLHTHDPMVNGCIMHGHTINNVPVKDGWQVEPTPSNSDLIIYHYQFKCNAEWVYKCKKRKSAASKYDWKNRPEIYKKLYRKDIKDDTRMIELWQKASTLKA